MLFHQMLQVYMLNHDEHYLIYFKNIMTLKSERKEGDIWILHVIPLWLLLAPCQAANAEAPLPRATVAACACGHVCRAVGFPGLCLCGGRVEGSRHRRGADHTRRWVARCHEDV